MTPDEPKATTPDGPAGGFAPHKAIAPDTDAAELRRLALEEQAYPDCEPLAVQCVLWLFRAYNAFMSAQAEQLRVFDLSPRAFNALLVLGNAPEQTLEPWQLAELLIVTRPSTTGLLDTLEGKGLVRRRRHPDDRRRVLVALTPAGQTILDQHAPTHYRSVNSLVADLSPDEQATLVTLLRRVQGAATAPLSEG